MGRRRRPSAAVLCVPCGSNNDRHDLWRFLFRQCCSILKPFCDSIAMSRKLIASSGAVNLSMLLKYPSSVPTQSICIFARGHFSFASKGFLNPHVEPFQGFIKFTHTVWRTATLQIQNPALHRIPIKSTFSTLNNTRYICRVLCSSQVKVTGTATFRKTSPGQLSRQDARSCRIQMFSFQGLGASQSVAFIPTAIKNVVQ